MKINELLTDQERFILEEGRLARKIAQALRVPLQQAAGIGTAFMTYSTLYSGYFSMMAAQATVQAGIAMGGVAGLQAVMGVLGTPIIAGILGAYLTGQLIDLFSKADEGELDASEERELERKTEEADEKLKGYLEKQDIIDT